MELVIALHRQQPRVHGPSLLSERFARSERLPVPQEIATPLSRKDSHSLCAHDVAVREVPHA